MNYILCVNLLAEAAFHARNSGGFPDLYFFV